MNKRGVEIELGWQFLFSLFFVAFILATMTWFITAQAKGNLIQEQIVAKEVCMLATTAKSGSTLEIEHAKNMVIEKKDSGIVVKTSSTSPGYFYPCYLKDVDFFTKDNRTYIKIK